MTNYDSRLAISLSLLFAASACGDAPDAAPDAGTVDGGSAIETDGGSEPDASPSIEPRFDALAEAVEADLERNLATGASVAVWLDDEIVYVGGFGTAEPEGARRPDDDTQFMIGSDTKKITGIVYLQRVAAEEASVETTLHDAVPELVMREAPDYVNATAHQLLSHQGGIIDWYGPTVSSTTDEALRSTTFGAFSRQAYPLVPPGRMFLYSNPNFSMVGLMAETLAGRPFADLAREDVFVPLEMSRTVARKSEVDANHAAGFGFADDDEETPHPVVLEDLWEDAFARPAGFVWSTPSDQMKLARFLVDGDERVLPTELVARIHEPQVALYPDLPGHYGYGLTITRGVEVDGDYYDVPSWSHGGNTLTHTSTFEVLPEQRFAISILSNGYGDDFTASVEAAFRTLVTLPAPTSSPEAPFEPSELDGLTGTYVDPFNVGEVQVSRVGDVLQLHMPDLVAAGVPYQRAMTRVSTRVWLANIQGTTVALMFVEGPDGEAYLAHRVFVATRAATPTPASFARPHRPDRETILRAIRRMRLVTEPALSTLR